MKIITFTLLALVSFTSINAQKNKRKAILFFKDATSLECIARISGTNIRYANALKEKELVANYNNLDSLIILDKGTSFLFQYKPVENKKNPIIMERVLKGKVNLYRHVSNQINPNYFKSKTSSSYYLERNNEALLFRFFKNFKKKAKLYFKDCPELVSLIGKRGYRINNLKTIVTQYNNCK